MTMTIRTWRRAFATLIAATTGAAVVVLSGALPEAASPITKAPVLVLFGILTAWIAASFWLSVVGAVASSGMGISIDAGPPMGGRPRRRKERSRTAILMTCRDEDVGRIFAGIRTIYESVRGAGGSDAFDFFVLSDTTDPDTWVEEERAWLETCGALGAAGRLHYRRRPHNRGRKIGNIVDFCERWGRGYDYMVVLDADSLMSGPTLLRMVETMDRDPRLGIVQAWPTVVNGETLFARVQQFAASMYGRLVAAGMSVLGGAQGNYWGHNAIIRVSAYMACCGLPRLPGREPLGGEILSHDFVEAALMVRCGWEVRLMTGLDGNYEEGPPNLIEHATRDRRWCQGNLQHVRLLFAKGLHPVSRTNLLVGTMAYLAAPLWLAFVAVTVYGLGPPALAKWVASGTVPTDLLILLSATAMLLLGPKLIGLAVALRHRESRDAHGGAILLVASTVAETILSAMKTPVMMLLHTRFILSILLGRDSGWGAQQRDSATVSVLKALDAHALETGVGLAFAAVMAWHGNTVFWIAAPMTLGLVLAAPMSAFGSSTRWGLGARRLGLFMIREEVRRPDLLSRLDALRQDGRPAAVSGRDGGFLAAVHDPYVNSLHLALLPPTAGSVHAAVDEVAIAKRLLNSGSKGVTTSEKRAVLSDPEALARLHVRLWAGRLSTMPVPTKQCLITRKSQGGSASDSIIPGETSYGGKDTQRRAPPFSVW